MLDFIRINNHGGISLFKELIIDGHEDFMPRVVTHIHSDHTVSIKKSLQNSPLIIGTPLTMEWLKLMGFRVPNNSSVPLDYGSSIRLDSGRLTLERAVHIPGTAQVVFDLDDGRRIVYTSDFKKPASGTPVINADVLIIDAVYGSPDYVREFDEYIDMILADLVRELLSSGPVYLYGYYGKIQEVMDVLRREGIDAPFVLPHKQYVLAKAAEGHGLNFGDYVHANSAEAHDIMRDGWFVYLTHITNRRYNGLGNHEVLSGWEFSRPYKKIGKNKWLVAFSDHADFRGLVEYVENSSPDMVVVNRPRSTYSELFAEFIKEKLGIKVFIGP